MELRHAFRALLHAPAFTLVVVLTLGLGIGANEAIFSLTDQVLLRLLPVRNPGELVLFENPGPFAGRSVNNNTFSYPMYRDLRDQATVFSGIIARFPAPLTLTANGQTERVNGDLVSGNYFDVLARARALDAPSRRTTTGCPAAIQWSCSVTPTGRAGSAPIPGLSTA